MNQRIFESRVGMIYILQYCLLFHIGAARGQSLTTLLVLKDPPPPHHHQFTYLQVLVLVHLGKKGKKL